MDQPQSSKHRQAEPLRTRHVFLDTQVYRTLGHNPEAPALHALKQHIIAHRVVLHTTDITLLEVKRQLHEAALKRARELRDIEKDLRRWRKQAPKATPKEVPEIDAAALGEELFMGFRSFIMDECCAIMHEAFGTVTTKEIFLNYFARRAPFDRQDAKEFPDAFAVAALSKWAASAATKMHVVTDDGAMGRAADADPNLLQLRTIQDVLSRAAAEMGPEAEVIAEAMLNLPAFDASFERLLQEQVKGTDFIYTGDLTNGEAYEGKLSAIEHVGDWSIVTLSDERAALIVTATITVSVEVQYDDHGSAVYDREDDVWFGVEKAAVEVEDQVEVEILIDIDCASGEVVGGELLTSEIAISGPYDEHY